MASQKSIERVIKILLTIGLAGLVGMCAFIVSPAGQRLVTSAVDFMGTIEQAAAAPGMAELREIGCDQAIVMPIGRMFEQLGAMSDSLADLGEELPPDAVEMPWVQCRIGPLLSRSPTCEDVARTYAQAAMPAAPFAVIVQESREERCTRVYDARGEFLRELEDELFLPGDGSASADAPSQ